MANCILNFGLTKTKAISILGHKTSTPTLRIAKNGFPLAYFSFNFLTCILVPFRDDLILITAFFRLQTNVPPSCTWPGYSVQCVINPNGKRFIVFTKTKETLNFSAPIFRLGSTSWDQLCQNANFIFNCMCASHKPRLSRDSFQKCPIS